MVFNSSLILSEFVESALSNAYIPYRNETVPGTIENALANLGGVAEWNILTEFWPDIKTFFGRHQPKMLRRSASRTLAINQVAGNNVFRFSGPGRSPNVDKKLRLPSGCRR